MLKRGLMIVLFLVLLSSAVSAWSTLTMPSPNSIYEGSVEAIRLSIDNFNKPQPIKEIQISLPGVNITSVTLTPATLWQETHNGTFVRWFNDTVSTSSANDIFEFNAFVLPVAANTNVTLVVTKINQNGSNASENHTILLLNDTSAPFIVSSNPANNSNVFSNGNHTISVNVNESESQISTVTYTYCNCSANSTNCTANATTITLNCTGNICNGTADFSSFTEGDYACYSIFAANNVGGNRTVFGRINFTGQPPKVTGTEPMTGSIYLVGDTVAIAANATDNQTAVANVTATIAYPNGTVATINLAKSGDRYSTNFAIPDVEGWYNITFSANDTMGNINNTQITRFKAVPVYNIVFSLSPSRVKPGRNVRAAGTVKLANGSNVPETWLTVDVRGTETNRTITNGTFSYTFSSPSSAGSYNIIVRVYAANGYNYSATKRLRVLSTRDSYTTGYGSDWEGEYSGIAIKEDSEVTEEPEPKPTITETEDAGTTEAPQEPETTPEEIIDEILNKPGNQITGSAVGTGTGTTILALLLLLVGVATLGLANTRIRNHVHTFAKEKVGSKFKKKKTESKGFSDQEWEEYFKRLKED